MISKSFSASSYSFIHRANTYDYDNNDDTTKPKLSAGKELKYSFDQLEAKKQ